MVIQLISPEREEKRRVMKELGLKTGKQYRKYIINKRREVLNESKRDKSINA